MTVVPGAKIKTIGILLYDGYATLDAMGPYHVLGELMGTQVFFVAKQKGMVTDMKGTGVKVNHSIEEVDSLDILVIPGGFKTTYAASQDTTLLSWIRKIDKTTTYTTSVCTGAWILAGTGLLTGRTATTHWYGKKLLKEKGIQVLNKRWVKDGKYWTSAGVTAGMDMSLALVNEIAGEQYTKAAMLDLEYDPQPPFEGGSEEKTDKDLVQMMRQMYDAGLVEVKNANPLAGSDEQTELIDPVCKMTVTLGESDTTIYKNKVYGFCSRMCKESFLKTPEKFLSVK